MVKMQKYSDLLQMFNDKCNELESMKEQLEKLQSAINKSYPEFDETSDDNDDEPQRKSQFGSRWRFERHCCYIRDFREIQSRKQAICHLEKEIHELESKMHDVKHNDQSSVFKTVTVAINSDHMKYNQIWSVFLTFDEDDTPVYFKNKIDAINYIISTLKDILEDRDSYDDDGNFKTPELNFGFLSHPLN